jgi:hypothetical protein
MLVNQAVEADVIVNQKAENHDKKRADGPQQETPEPRGQKNGNARTHAI